MFFPVFIRTEYHHKHTQEVVYGVHDFRTEYHHKHTQEVVHGVHNFLCARCFGWRRIQDITKCEIGNST